MDQVTFMIFYGIALFACFGGISFVAWRLDVREQRRELRRKLMGL